MLVKSDSDQVAMGLCEALATPEERTAAVAGTIFVSTAVIARKVLAAVCMVFVSPLLGVRRLGE